ncbi:MAG TPA: cytochrome c biogenesis protein CcsA [Gemmatimonadaceae bacterium]|nr:cytochrome c biogenesis protein CcsA [Gemmatimonadaceae bacterium]
MTTLSPAPSAEDAIPAKRAGIDLLFLVAVLAIAVALVRVIYFTPFEAIQGPAQKIFYLHLPAALDAFMAFGVVALAGIGYLWLGDLRLDRAAESSAEVGVVFTTVVLVTGPIWARPVWGTWWTWDARLTLTLFLWFIYVSYLVLRGAIDDRALRARYSAVLGILGSLLIPFIHLSVYLFRTLHPRPIVLKPSAPSLPPEMLTTLIISFIAFSLFYLALVRQRYRLATERDLLELEEGR